MAAAYRYVFTLNEQDALKLDGTFLELFKKELGSFCKKWCFQKEKGLESDLPHFQGQLSLKTKLRKAELVKAFHPEWNIYWSVQQDESKSSIYVTKEDTRVDGPWSDKDVPAYVPRALRNLELKGWQQELRDALVQPGDDRTVHIVLDKAGGIGKSTFCKYMSINHRAFTMPGTIGRGEDLMKLVCNSLKGVPPSQHVIFLLDLPRAINKNNWDQWCSVLEQLKNGHITDWRYQGENRWIEPPAVCCFTNSLPPPDLFTSDRWNIHSPDRFDIPVRSNALLRSPGRSLSRSMSLPSVEVIDLSHD